MFTGEYRATIDKDGCVVMPARFIEALPEDDREGLVTVARITGISEPCVHLYAMSYWKKTCRDILEPIWADVEVGRLMLELDFSELDQDGRLYLPDSVMRSSVVDPEVILLGACDSIELWDSDMYASWVKNQSQQ